VPTVSENVRSSGKSGTEDDEIDSERTGNQIDRLHSLRSAITSVGGLLRADRNARARTISRPGTFAQGPFTLALDSKNFLIPAENLVQLHDNDASSHKPFD
jgi:hypothetical protein